MRETFIILLLTTLLLVGMCGSVVWALQQAQEYADTPHCTETIGGTIAHWENVPPVLCRMETP